VNHGNLEDILLRSRNRFRAIVDAVPDPMCVLNDNMRVIGANRAYAELQGKEPREVLGVRPVYPRYSEPFLACLQSLARRTFETGETTGDVCCLGAQDSGMTWLDIAVSPLPDGEDPQPLAVVVIRDVTAQKEMEERIRRHAEDLDSQVRDRTADLQRTIKQLRETEALKRDLFNMIVHDLKSPLAQVMANIEMLKGAARDDDLLELIEAAGIGGDDMALMIGNLLDVERMEENRARFNFKPTMPGEAARETVSRLEAHARLQEVALTVEMEAEPPAMVMDCDLIGRVLRNLLMNAIEFSPAGTAVVLALRFDPQSHCLEMAVEDQGPGIPEDQRAAIFEKFRQGADRKSGSGSGLGLAFCKMAVAGHHGTIDVRPGTNGRGSRFQVGLPLLGLDGRPV
jgi:PAS domain S-box-containing protein